MNIARIFAVVVTLGVLSTASSQEPPKAPAPAAAKPVADAPAGASQTAGGAVAAPAPPASSPSAAPASGGQAPASTTPPPPSASVPKTGVVKDNEFIPTDEIQPDEAVTFPVDI